MQRIAEHACGTRPEPERLRAAAAGRLLREIRSIESRAASRILAPEVRSSYLMQLREARRSLLALVGTLDTRESSMVLAEARVVLARTVWAGVPGSTPDLSPPAPAPAREAPKPRQYDRRARLDAALAELET